jgi:hypothetical protein
MGDGLIIDIEEFNEWLNIHFQGHGFSPSMTVLEWDESGKHPKEIEIVLTYKMGDGWRSPYYNRPPDDMIIEHFKKYGWEADTYEIMEYPNLINCPKCGIVDISEAVEVVSAPEEGIDVYRHKKCGSLIEGHVIGNKWIYGLKVIKLRGDETREEIKNLIVDTIQKMILFI